MIEGVYSRNKLQYRHQNFISPSPWLLFSGSVHQCVQCLHSDSVSASVWVSPSTGTLQCSIWRGHDGFWLNCVYLIRPGVCHWQNHRVYNRPWYYEWYLYCYLFCHVTLSITSVLFCTILLMFCFSEGCIPVTSAEDGGAETTQYLILQGPDDGNYVYLSPG